MKRHSILALVLLGVLGCSGLKEEIPGQTGNEGNSGNDGVVTLTATVSLGDTRALDADGVKTFAPGERVAFIYTTRLLDIRNVALSEPLMADNILEGGKKALLTVSLLGPKPGGELTVVYPASMAITTVSENVDIVVDYGALANQDGTLTSIASHLDLASFTGSLTASASLPAPITLSNQFAITAFTIENENGEDITSTITCLNVSDGTNSYSVNRTAAEGPIYMAMQPVSGDKTLYLCADDGSTYYMKTVTGKTLGAGKMYPVEVVMPVDQTGLSEPLTIEAKVGGARVGYHKAYFFYTDEGNVQYRLNGGPWMDYDNNENPGILLENAGDKVSFRGNNAFYGQYKSYSYANSYIYADYQECYLYGNVMSLVNAAGFVAEDTISERFAFYGLFANQSLFLSHETKQLLLPARNLKSNCYCAMFRGCKGLTRAPALPAQKLAFSCYMDMFRDCTALVDVPTLPALTLDSSCYESMFMGCTGLINAPAIAAEVMSNQSCMNMFRDCSSLINPPELPAATLALQCYCQMFMDCTSLKTTPVLPAKTLKNYCYQNMFWGCSSLEQVICLATDLSATDCTLSWLYKTPETGTFFKEADIQWNLGTVNGIPTGWTVETYVTP
jgi:hypothetical protein